MKFIVKGICFVPHEVRARVEAKSREDAIERAREIYKEQIVSNSADYAACFGFDITEVEKL